MYFISIYPPDRAAADVSGLIGERYFLEKLGLQCWLGWCRILTKRLKVTAVLSGWLSQYVPPDGKVGERKTPSSTKSGTLLSFALAKTSISLSDLLFFPLLYPLLKNEEAF